MTTIKLNSENKTEITFSYDNGLPYKKAIRPSIEYGDWKINSHITLIKVNLSDDEVLGIIEEYDNLINRFSKINGDINEDLRQEIILNIYKLLTRNREK